MRRWWRAFLLTVVLAGPALAASPDAAVATLLERSGMDRSVVDIAEAMDELVESARGKIGNAKTDLLAASAKLAYAPEALQQELCWRLAATLTGTDLDAAMAWFSSPLGARTVRLEAEAAGKNSGVDAEERRAVETASLERLALLTRYVRASGDAELSADVLTSVQLGYIRALAEITPKGALDMVRIKVRYAKARDELVAGVTSDLVAASARAYRSLSDHELRLLVEFVESPAGKRYNEAMGNAIRRTLDAAAGRFVEEVSGDGPVRV